jgi:hypothetical protein
VPPAVAPPRSLDRDLLSLDLADLAAPANAPNILDLAFGFGERPALFLRTESLFFLFSFFTDSATQKNYGGTVISARSKGTSKKESKKKRKEERAKAKNKKKKKKMSCLFDSLAALLVARP